MYTFGRYTTLTTTHNLVSWRQNLNWDGNNERNIESLIMLLFSASIASLSPPYTGSLTSMLWSSWTDNCGKKLEQVAVQCDHQCSLSYNHWQLVISQLVDNT